MHPSDGADQRRLAGAVRADDGDDGALLDLKRDSQIRDILISRHHKKPGVSAHHPYSRVTAIPIVFDETRRELREAREYYQYKRRCLYCDMLRQEIGAEKRVVRLTTWFAVLVPYAARAPLEARLAEQGFDGSVAVATSFRGACARMLETDATHLLFVDYDMQFDARIVLKLLAAAKPVIGCVYPSTAEKPRPIANVLPG